MKNFLTGRSQQVIVNGCTNSSNSSCTIAVPLLHNSLPKNVISTKVELYADDMLLYNTVHTIKMTV